MSDPAFQRLTDRVVARVKDARLAAEARSRAALPRRRRRRTADQATLGTDTRTPAQLHEARALRRVFLDLGESYRSYRRRTGEPVAAEVRDAAYRFRKERDLTSLVSVAASLEQLDAMTW
ncbi:MAG: hypothetical protein ACREM9_07435 [Gemmatimonadales bacterium]